MASDPEAGALDWLYSFSDMERGVGWSPRASPDEQWKTGRTRALLDLAGAPDRSLRCVLVAGTKGKGSTAAFLASILEASGVRTGLYTQPHLQSFRERIRVAGMAIAPGDFARAVDECRELPAGLARAKPDAGEPTTFELATVAAIRHFVRERCAVAVLEVGLGGRLDATNAVEPEVSVVTRVSRDHTQILGTRLDRIAREKAGILRRDRAALLARQRPSAERALRSACRSAGARCGTVGPLTPSARLGIPGDHQRQNAALAVAAARELGTTDERAIAAGLARVRWPGRLEQVHREPPLVLDGAHNDASALDLAADLRRRYPRRRWHLVVGMYRDKDARAILRPLLPLAAGVWATEPPGPRRLPASELADICRRMGARGVEAGADVAAALRAARRGSAPVLVTGSLALVGAARDALGLPVAERLWS